MDENTLVFSTTRSKTWEDFYLQFFPNLSYDKNNPSKARVNCVNERNHQHGDKNKSAFVDVETGVYYCSVCGSYSPRRFLIDLYDTDPVKASVITSEYKAKVARKTNGFHVDLWRKGLNTPMIGYRETVAKAQSMLVDDPMPIITEEYMASRGLTIETLMDWNIGRLQPETDQEECLVFPYFLNDEVVALKGRTFDGRKGSVKGATLVPYGVHRIESAKVVILCEGETDTLITYQALKNNGRLSEEVAVVGVPGAGNFPKEWQRFFAHVYHIYVIPQADAASDTMIATVIDRLGEDRVSIVQLPWSFSDIGKDIADWTAQHSEKELANLIPDIEYKPQSMTTEDMIAEADNEVEWIVPGLLATQEKAMIFGAPKSMKTFVAIHLAYCIATGKPFLHNNDWTPEPQRVLFVEEEGNRTQFARRIKRMFKDDDNGNIKWLHKTGIKLDTEIQKSVFRKEVEEFKPRLIIFDPFKSLHGQDENDNTAMGVLWDIINKFIIVHPDTAMLFIHHIPKSEKGKRLDLYSARGAGIIAAELDIGFGLRHSDSEDNTLYMNIEGREVPNSSGEAIIRFDDNFDMKMDGFKTDISPSKQKDKNKGAIVGLLAETGNTMTVREIAEALDMTDAKVRGALKDLLEEDLVTETVGESDGGRKPKAYYV